MCGVVLGDMIYLLFWVIWFICCFGWYDLFVVLGDMIYWKRVGNIWVTFYKNRNQNYYTFSLLKEHGLKAKILSNKMILQILTRTGTQCSLVTKDSN